MLMEACQSLTQLEHSICAFITEIKKKNGSEYPGKTIMDAVLMLQLYLERAELPNYQLLSNKRIKNCLDSVMRERAKMGLIPARSEFISEEEEENLWKSGVLGTSTPDVLRQTAFFLVGKHFGLRGGSEHRKLRRGVSSQIKEVYEGKTLVMLYEEEQSKNRQGGLRSKDIPARDCRMYCICEEDQRGNLVEEDRCPAHILKRYMHEIPMASGFKNSFYCQTLPSWRKNGYSWYSMNPVGHVSWAIMSGRCAPWLASRARKLTRV